MGSLMGSLMGLYGGLSVFCFNGMFNFNEMLQGFYGIFNEIEWCVFRDFIGIMMNFMGMRGFPLSVT